MLHLKRKDDLRGQGGRFYQEMIGLGFETIKEGEQRFLGGTMWGGIMMKFCRR